MTEFTRPLRIWNTDTNTQSAAQTDNQCLILELRRHTALQKPKGVVLGKTRNSFARTRRRPGVCAMCVLRMPPRGTEPLLLQRGKTSSYHSVYREQLVSAFQAAVSISYTTRDDSGDVDWRILFFASHNVESKAFFRFG